MKQLKSGETRITSRKSEELESVGFPAAEGGSKKSAEVAPKKQNRALLTRDHLIDAAQRVFARDGFEQARIEDIASLAGKTRGAFYANFDDKEDVFFAIFEEYAGRDRALLRPLLADKNTAHARLDVIAGYLSLLAQDRQRTLLMLEFKMYAIRHPRRRKRLAELHAAMRSRCALPELWEVLPELQLQSEDERRIGSLALSAAVDGFALNRLFNPEELEEGLIKEYLRLCVGQAFPQEVEN